MNLYSRLKSKGWEDYEIQHAFHIISKSKKSKKIILLDKIIFWIFLILTIFGTLISSAILIPILFFVKTIYLYLFTILISLAFGSFITIVIEDIDYLGGIQILPELFLPAFGIINAYIIVSLTNTLSNQFNYTAGIHPPLPISLIYGICFVIPYLIIKYIRR